MKNTFRNFFILVSSATLLASCASTSDVEDLRYQLRIVNKKIEDMKSTTVGQLQKRQAAALGHMDQLETDILELKAQLEESYHLNQRLKEQNKELEESINSFAQHEAAKREEVLKRLEEQQQAKEAALLELNNKLLMQEESVKAIQAARIKEAERRAKEAALEAELARKRSQAATKGSYSTKKHLLATRKKVKKSVVAPPIDKGTKDSLRSSAGSSVAQPTQDSRKQAQVSKIATVPPRAATSNFEKGNNLYNRKKYKAAFNTFEQIVNSPSSDKRVDARFMMGECLFEQKEYDKAIMQYQKIISQYSSHPIAPNAMLKQAAAFEKLLDKDTAKVIYKKLAKKHPATAEGNKAKEKLSKM